MESFYIIRDYFFLPNKFYKVYVKEDELWFVKIGGQFADCNVLSGQSILVELIYQGCKKYWIDPRRKLAEQTADTYFTKDVFPKGKHNFIVPIDAVTKVEIHELRDRFELHIQPDENLQFQFPNEINFDKLASYFSHKPLVRTNYLW